MSIATSIDPKQVHDIIGRHQLADGYDMVLDIDKSRGPWLHDSARGEDFLDCFTCFASWPLGYNHPGLNEPDFEAELLRAAKCNPSNADLYSREMAAFVEAFATHASPEGFDHHFWIAGGSLAVENAVKAAFDWKARRLGRTDFNDDANDLAIAHFQYAFHGRSGYTMSMTNTLPDKVGLFPKFKWPRIFSPGIEFDLDGNIANDVATLEAKALAELEAFYESWSRRGNYKHLAGVLIEPIQCEGGDRHFRPEFMQGLRDFCDRADALLLYDEVQTGFFGSGKPWMWQHHGVAPDIAAFGKKAQVCGIYAGKRLDEVEDNVFVRSSRINSTWGSNLVDMVRSRRFIELIVEHGYTANTADRGEQILAGLRRIAKDTNAYTNPRGVGSLLAVDFTDGDARNAAIGRCYDERLLVLPCGPQSLRLRIPLNLEASEADEVLNRFEAAVKKG
ncbi:MAG: L-lysine 6-transaminase [Phycisphaera sp.]|nr:L-lysine 6-transaminase [Phycisphaera sp.]